MPRRSWEELERIGQRNCIRVLNLLAEEGQLNAEEIGSRLRLSPQTVARVDDALVKTFMVSRVGGHKHTYEITDFGQRSLPELERLSNNP